ncbi:hypothetical protein GF360_00580 [candidate division WWE3 bacterium]|nr:hypothetical protein [candidate division WWE3 bacterium]
MNDFDMNLTQKMAKNYKKAAKKDKSKILDDYCKLTQVKRNTAVKRFRRKIRKPYPKALPIKPKKRGRKKKYSQIHKLLIQNIWDLADQICAERLYPCLPLYVEQLHKSEKLNGFPQEVIDCVLNIPLGTLKYFIADFPKPTYKKKRKGNKDLYKQIPIKANFGKHSNKPGFVEVDYVEHNQGSNGTWAISGCYNDIFSGWITRAAGMGKSYESVKAIHKKCMNGFFHKIIELHPDNMLSTLKLLLEDMITKENPTGLFYVSRSRPYESNDNAHVEQKNGDKIRRLVGYHRYGTKEQLNLLNKLYSVSDLYDNFFIPSAKLKEKIMDTNGRVIKRKHDKPKTPFQRLLESEDISPIVKNNLKTACAKLNMVDLKAQRDKLVQKLTKTVLN